MLIWTFHVVCSKYRILCHRCEFLLNCWLFLFYFGSVLRLLSHLAVRHCSDTTTGVLFAPARV